MAFRLLRAQFELRELAFSRPDLNDGDQNLFTVIIGKNGVGKSRLLGQIARIFRNADLPTEDVFLSTRERRAALDKQFDLSYTVDGRQVDLTLKGAKVSTPSLTNFERPSRVICTAVTPFEKFPVEKAPRTNVETYKNFTENAIYRYLGAKNQWGQYSSRTHLGRFIESLFIASDKSLVDTLRIADVFEFVGYEPALQVKYALTVTFTQRTDLFNALSSFEEVQKYVTSAEGGPYSRKAKALEILQSNPGLLARLRHSLEPFANGPSSSASFNLDFRRAHDYSHREVFFDISLLTRLGFIALKDATLVKRGSGVAVNIRDASSGEQSILMTILGIASEIQNNSLICIDEPEVSLHPSWQETFIEWLQNAFSDYRGCHFVLATHSPQILARIDGAHSTILLMDEGKTELGYEYARRSADFQLVEAFKTPGYKNEYLMRQALTVYSHFGVGGRLPHEQEETFEMLKENLSELDVTDPVRELIVAMVEARKSAENK